MKKYGLCCPIRRANPYRKMKNAMKTNNYAPNLLDREFESYGPRLVLLTDITYWSSTLYVQSQNPQKSVKLKEQRWRESQ